MQSRLILSHLDQMGPERSLAPSERVRDLSRCVDQPHRLAPRELLELHCARCAEHPYPALPAALRRGLVADAVGVVDPFYATFLLHCINFQLRFVRSLFFFV